MPTIINSETYYRTAEVCQTVGISRSTLIRWLSRGTIKGVLHRDRRGWRLFTETDIKRIEEVANEIK